MKYYSLAFQSEGKVIYLHPITGSVLQSENAALSDFKTNNLPVNVIEALEFCDFPYKLAPPQKTSRVDYDPLVLEKITKSYKYVRILRNINYYFSVKFSSLRQPFNLSSREIFDCFGTGIIKMDDDWKGCFNRALTVSKLSHTFKENGVLFIGIQMPLRNMHAWIIEKNYQPDSNDRHWINFKPIAAYTFIK